MNGDFQQRTGFGRSRIGRQATGAAMNLGVGQAFEGQPDLLRMIEIAQRAQQGELVKALHEQYRMLLCAPAGVAPGDKEWPEAHKRFAADIGTITSEQEIPGLTYRAFQRIKRYKGGMLYLNYVAMEALKRYRMPIARALISSVVTAKFNPDTATERSMELYLQVMKLVNAATVAAHEAGITVANESALMEELGKLDSAKAAATMAPKVGPLLAELDPKKLKLGGLVRWRENLNAAWRAPVHVWWVEIEEVRMEEEAPEPEPKADPSPTEKLAKLNREATGDPDDRRIFDLPPEYAGIMYSQFAKSSGPSKIRVGGGESDEWKTILEALDDSLFDDLVNAVNNRPLREYLETGSLGRSTEVLIKMYGEYCGGSAQWQLMAEDIESALKFEFPLSAYATQRCALTVERGLMSPNLNPECKCCMRSFLAKVVRGMHAGL